MPVSREQRIRQYIDLVTGGDGTESVLATMDAAADITVEAVALGDDGKTEAARESARAGLENLARGAEVAPEQLADVEAIIIPELRPVYDIKDGTFTTLTFDGTPTPGHSLWTKLTSDAALKQRIESVLPAIGRIELLWNTNIPYGGTGFVVGRNLLMTNRHVAQIFAAGIGDRNLQFINGRAAGIDFKRDSAAGHVFKILNVRMIHPYWDMAILEVEGLPDSVKPLSLAVADARDLLREEVVAIGYPAFDNRNAIDVQTDLMRNRFQIKRLQPGMLQGGFDTESFGKIVSAATHDCSTTGGNSGTGMVNLATGEVVALHFAGRYLERNYAVPTGALARDQRVVDLGLNFSGATGGTNDWGAWWNKADSASPAEGVTLVEVGGVKKIPGVATQTPSSGGVVVSPGGSVTFEVPLRITVSFGATP